jgi:hypothetical protein
MLQKNLHKILKILVKFYVDKFTSSSRMQAITVL